MRAWDSYQAYLFDLDGTLLHCVDAVHYFGFCKALEFLAGYPLTLEGVTAHGNTDIGIIRDAMALAKIPESSWRPGLPASLKLMETYVVEHQNDMKVNPIAGAMSALQYLQPGALLGVATGNLETVGRLKLKLAGFNDSFSFGSFSDGLETREAVFAKAMAEPAEKHHRRTNLFRGRYAA